MIRTIRAAEPYHATIAALSQLWCDENVFRHLDMRFRTFAGAHELFKRIESGDVRAYISFDDENSRILGAGFGWLEEPGIFTGHLCYRRKVDVFPLIEEATEIMLKEYEDEGIRIKAITGYIPVSNRASIRFAKRYGCKDTGISEKIRFLGENGFEKTVRMVREL